MQLLICICAEQAAFDWQLPSIANCREGKNKYLSIANYAYYTISNCRFRAVHGLTDFGIFVLVLATHSASSSCAALRCVACGRKSEARRQVRSQSAGEAVGRGDCTQVRSQAGRQAGERLSNERVLGVCQASECLRFAHAMGAIIATSINFRLDYAQRRN